MKIVGISDVSDEAPSLPCTGCGTFTDGATARMRVVRHASHWDVGLVAEPQCARCWGLEAAVHAAGGPSARWPGAILPPAQAS